MRSKQTFIRQAIEASFTRLLDQRPFEKVTVKDIVEDCGLTRNTFYNYFQDTYDIVDSILRAAIRDLVINSRTVNTPGDAFREILKFADERPRIVRHLLNSPKKDELMRYFRQSSAMVVDHLLDAITADAPLPEPDRSLIRDFYHAAFDGLLYRWIETGRTDVLNEQLARMGDLFSATMHFTVDYARQNPT